MSFNLKLIFTGLCAFVEHANGGREKVLLIDGRNEITDPALIHCCAALRFNRADLDPASLRQADLCRDGVLLSCHDSLCFLNREDLKVEAVTGSVGVPPLTIVKGSRPAGATAPDPSSRADWSWVADLNSIKPGAGTPQPGWFTTPPTVPAGLSRPPIVARFELDRGNLSTLEFFRSQDNTHFPSVFSLNGGAYSQALASYVQCQFTCDDNTQVQISSTRWDGGPGAPLLFSRRTNDLILEISNAPFFDVMQELFPVGNGWSFPPSFTQGHSFLHFYQLQPPPFAAGDFPGATNRAMAAATLTNTLSFDKGVGCSPATTAPTTFP